MKKILILAGRYLPGYKDGGPLRSLINLTEMFGDEYDIHIACYDRDQGDVLAYPNIQYNCWNSVGKAKVWYVAPSGFSNSLILQLADGMDIVYLTSFYGDYGYKTLVLKKKGKIECPVSVASMGVFSRDALAHKALKKRLFITGCKLAGLFKNITWSVTSELEAEDLKREIGVGARYIVAEDLPRMTVPGRTREWGDALRVCFLSRICEHKGLDIAIDAMIRVGNDNMEFTVYGPIQENTYWNSCKAKLEQSSLRWSYFGDVPSEVVQQELAKQDVLLFPSKSENYGHVVFEALSVGCIPIISDRTPWKMLNESGAGYEVPRNSMAFAEALDELVSCTIEERNAKSQRAVRLALEKVAESKRESGYREIFG